MKYVAVDIETEGLDFNRHKIIGTGINGQFKPDGALHELPESGTFQNGKFDIKFLNKRAGDTRWTRAYAFDTLLAASILVNRPESLSLDSLAAHYLNLPTWKDETNKMFKEKDWVKKLYADPNRMAALKERNLKDLAVTENLTPVLEQQLKEEQAADFFFDKIMPAARMLTDTEYRGMRLDVPATQKKLEETAKRLEELIKQLNDWALPDVINWNSPIQLSKLLSSRGYDLSWWDFKKRKTVQSTCSEKLQSFLPNKHIECLLNYRATKKLIGYLEGWLEDQFEGRIYCNFNMAATRTGRLSSSNPNLQQIPRDSSIRGLFIPTQGKVFVIADYAQIEPRVAAHYSKDEALLEVFKNDRDFYGSIAIDVLGVKCGPNEVKALFPKERKVAKEIGLSILYGIGKDKLSNIIKLKSGVFISPTNCAKIIHDYFESYPKLLEFRKSIIDKIEHGTVLTTHYGRHFKLDPERAFSTGVNTLIQSTASDACLFSQLQVDKALKENNIKAPLIAIIHDEVIRECNQEDAAHVGEIMENIMCNQGFICPLKLEWVVGTSWGDKK